MNGMELGASRRVGAMELKDKVAVITGGTGGIGQALARAFLADGARTVVISDLDADRVAEVTSEIGCEGIACDVTNEPQVEALVEATLAAHGPIDLFCSNAGSVAKGVLTDATNDQWQQQWELHVMSHLYAARAVLPSMIAQGHGYLLNTASAAGLLAAIPSGPYSVSKAAAIKMAEMLAITHGDDGIGVSVLCPQGVNTAMAPSGLADGGTDGIIEASELADVVVQALREERFHVLPHPEVADYIKRKADDPDRWLKGMRRLRARSIELEQQS
jgi:NAD(P)-dependent dehydrogenase (short-subunit alcohol dehydrogenase family)